MRAGAIGCLLILAAGNAAAYNYDYNYDFMNWWPADGQFPQLSINGSVSFGQTSCCGYGGVSFAGPSALIYTPTLPGNPNDYEVSSQIWMQQPAGTYMHLLRASSPSVMPGNGSYVSVEFATPTSPWGTTSVMAQMNINQRSGNQLVQLGSRPVPLKSGSTIRTVIFGNRLWVWVDGIFVWDGTVTLTTGYPGIGGNRNALRRLSVFCVFEPLDRTP